MIKFFVGIITFPFESSNPDNRFRQFLQFVFKDYPVYFWVKPSLWKALVFPFLVVWVIFVGTDKAKKHM